MQHGRLLGPARVAAVAALVIAGACAKRPTASREAAPKPALPVPAAAGKPSAEGLLASTELAKLDAFKRKVFDQVVNREPSACGKGHSLLYSVEHDSACRASFYAVRYVAHLANAGFSESEIGEKVEQRFRAPHVSYIDLSQAPSKGSPTAKVTVVEFADYGCEHCRLAQPVLRSILSEYPKDVVLYFKQFPLGGHVSSLNAAMAATAAQNQGKFWPFSDKVWENWDSITPAVLEGIAKEIDLDFQRWYSDVGSDQVRTHVQRDRAEGRDLAIQRTPAIFINGRSYTDEVDLPSLKDWIDEELGR